MSNTIAFKNNKPAAAVLLDLMHEIEPWEPEYWLTKENIIRVTEELMHPMYINAAHKGLTDISHEYPDLKEEIDRCRDALRGASIDLCGNYDAQVKYYDDEGYGPTTRVWVLFINYRNGEADLRLYRNRAAAKGQVTKFFHRVIRTTH